MGLFDIFRRRSKKSAQETPTSESLTTSTSLTSDASASASVTASESAASSVSLTTSTTATHSAETATPAASATAAATQPSTREETASVSAEPAAVAETSAQPVASVASAAPASVTQAASRETASVTAVASQESRSSLTSTASVSVASISTASAEASTSAVTSEPVEESESASVKTDEQLYDQGLEKTRHTFGERLNALLANFRHVDEGFFDDLEETLIGADVGFDMAVKLSDELRDEVKLQNAKRSQDVQNVIVEKMVEIYDQAGNDEESTALNMAPEGPTVILFVGVNGVGKTTTIGKMANRYHQAGKKVLLAAADTFRAGATEQLDVWAKRGHVDIVKGQPQSDPAAVVFDAVQKAKRENYDILFVDTAGRLQNKVNLMNELAKMKRIITREIPAAPHEVLLVLDATTGQNALTQAKLFKESTDVTGIVLTKLDGTARGGIVLAIRNELHVPVKFIGLGEQIDDLRPFDPNEFVYGLFKGLIDVSALEKA
ncbi:signal recognition particle-docking protein FtsY [Levilactobacillus spicheri]|uniref:Signal recognition particle receptor FtsY n=1 Tax=Levilactobacillus spicheri DSM 15429 TaxID=1423805 RepID=A0A0R1QUX0_9LACO|nr:signal recognition particle-docking protein FtsY [Levilactobacillus spicheri]KRL46362.1 Signal recognition particle GTPase [Levilactobacillus spicheri DSM 15429]